MSPDSNPHTDNYLPTGNAEGPEKPLVPQPTPAPHPSGHSAHMTPVASLRPITSTLNNPAIGLPDALQSFAQQGRSGIVVVGQHDLIGLEQGAIAYVVGADRSKALRALHWTGAIGSSLLKDALAGDREPAVVLQDLEDLEKVDAESIAHSFATYIEEEFARIVLEGNPDWDFLTDKRSDDPLAVLQMDRCGSYSVSALLMECMRRRDEQSMVESLMPFDWDLPLGGQQEGDPPTEIDGAAALISCCDGNTPAWLAVERAGMPPWIGFMALGTLHQHGWIRLGTANELVLAGDAVREEGDLSLAEGLYRRAMEHGMTVPRIHVALAEIAAATERPQEAAQLFAEAGESLSAVNPSDAAIAFRNAIKLGGEDERYLSRLLDLYRHLDDQENALKTCWELTQSLIKQGRHQEARIHVEDLEELGADPARCLRLRGQLATQLGNLDEALSHWDALEQLAKETSDEGTLAYVHEQILGLDPGRPGTALHHARHQISQGDSKNAAMTLRAALAAAGDRIDQQMTIACRELISECDPADSSNRRWLAQAYQKLTDRDSALQQLRELVVTQANAGDDEGLIDTLSRLLQLDPADSLAIRHLTALHDKNGQHDAAERVWQEGIQAAMARSDASSAHDLVRESLSAHPFAIALRLLAVRCCNRLGRKDEAIEECVAAARLARLAKDSKLAQQCLHQLLPVRHDDLTIHAELLAIVRESSSANLQGILDDAIAAAMDTNNLGLAIAWSSERITLLGNNPLALAERRRLLHCHHRAGDTMAAVAQGQSLADDLLARDLRDEAKRLLEELVNRYPNSSALVTRLARLQRDRDEKAASLKSYQQAIVLLQQEQKTDQAIDLLFEVTPLISDRDLLIQVKNQLKSGQAVTWHRSQ